METGIGVKAASKPQILNFSILLHPPPTSSSNTPVFTIPFPKQSEYSHFANQTAPTANLSIIESPEPLGTLSAVNEGIVAAKVVTADLADQATLTLLEVPTFAGSLLVEATPPPPGGIPKVETTVAGTTVPVFPVQNNTTSNASTVPSDCQAPDNTSSACAPQGFLETHNLEVSLTGGAAALSCLITFMWYLSKKSVRKAKLKAKAPATLCDIEARSSPAVPSPQMFPRVPAPIRPTPQFERSCHGDIESSTPTESELNIIRGKPPDYDDDKEHDEFNSSRKQGFHARDTVLPSESMSQLCSPVEALGYNHERSMPEGQDFGPFIDPYGYGRSESQYVRQNRTSGYQTRNLMAPKPPQKEDFTQLRDQATSEPAYPNPTFPPKVHHPRPSHFDEREDCGSRAGMSTQRSTIISSVSSSGYDKHISGVASFLGELPSIREERQYGRGNELCGRRRETGRFDEDNETMLSYVPEGLMVVSNPMKTLKL